MYKVGNATLKIKCLLMKTENIFVILLKHIMPGGFQSPYKEQRLKYFKRFLIIYF